MALPEGFIDLATAYNTPGGTFVNIIGAVVDIQPPTTTRTNEYVFTFKLLDQRLQDSVYGYQGLKVRFFNADQRHLPKVCGHGDVVLLRQIKMFMYSNQPVALSNYQTGVLVFPASTIPDPSYSIAYQGTNRLKCLGVPGEVEKLSLEEQAYIIHLKAQLSSTVAQIPAAPAPVWDQSRKRDPAPLPDQSRKHDHVPLPDQSRKYDHVPLPDQSRKRHPIPLPERSRKRDPVPLPEQSRQRDPEPLPGQSRKRNPVPLPDLGPPGKKPKRSGLGPKFQLVEDLRHHKFADICAQVVKKFPNHFGTCELYVTDYTENKDMWYYTPPEEEANGQQRDGDEYGYSGIQKKTWPGPYGWLVLKVNMKDPHAHFANQSVNEGDIVLLRNVKMKIMKEGAKLEGDMWPDDRNAEKVQVSKMKYETEEIAELLVRKEKYWAARKAKEQQQQQQQNQPDGAKQLTKGERKRRNKQLKKERALATAAGADANEGRKGSGNGKRDDGMNKHIRCSNEEATLTSVREILDRDNVRHTAKIRGKTQIIPFTNAKYRAKVRVVDFEPKALEDFAVPPLPDEEEEASPIDAMDWEASPKHEWFFELLLEEAGTQVPATGAEKERVWVGLGHEEAQYLLGRDMDDPQDLRSNPRLLTKLREKLCILWGNLEEKGADEVLSNRAFECCLLEYGVEMDDEDTEKEAPPFGYKKLFRMMGTTIL